MLLGGANLASTFVRHDLIDEYRVYVHPVAIGQGKPLFQQVQMNRAEDYCRIRGCTDMDVSVLRLPPELLAY
jgi:riboflavin biosynthesis pyrimidine reductase